MAELEDEMHGDMLDTLEPLEQSDDVRRIKEEWMRLQMEAEGKRYLGRSANSNSMQEADELRAEIKAEIEEANRLRVAAHGGKPPPSRLPSLKHIVGKVPSIPSMEIATGIGKKLPDLGSVSHRLGILTDPKELEPKAVTLDKTTYNFGADTPTQTDIKWSPPDNASRFKSLTYEIEVDGGQGWAPLTDNRLPIVRVYFTSNKILVSRYSRLQESEPVAVRLRVRAVGTIKNQALEEKVNGPWSSEIWLSIEGSSITGNTAM